MQKFKFVFKIIELIAIFINILTDIYRLCLSKTSMCGRYELTAEYEKLPSLLKKNHPEGFKENYTKQDLIRPNDPVIVIKNEGKVTTSIMLWGFISEWAKDPLNKEIPRPFNARAETIREKKLFKGSWRQKRCLFAASGFFEKGYRISRKDQETFWMAGLWNRWMSSEGSEIESCCVITTEPNELIKPFHNRMPVIIPNGLEEKWVTSIKNTDDLKALEPILKGWEPEEWQSELIDKTSNIQLSLF